MEEETSLPSTMSTEITDDELWAHIRSFDVKTLKEILSTADIPNSVCLKDNLQRRLFYAVKLGLPTVSTGNKEEESRRTTRARKLQFGDNFKLPHPLNLEGWQDISANIPPICEDGINQYFRRRNREIELSTDGMKSLGKGRSIAISRGRVHTVEYHSISEIVGLGYIKGLVVPQTRVHEHPYMVWMLVFKKTGVIHQADCHCIAGLSGICKHVAALLTYVRQQVERGCSQSSTSQLQQWHKPSSSSKLQTSAFLKDIHTPKVSSSGSMENRKSRRDMFDPRAVKKAKKLHEYSLDSLADVSNGKAAVLLYASHQRPVHSTLTSSPDITHLTSTIDVDVSSSSPIRVASVEDAFQKVKHTCTGSTCTTDVANQMTEELSCSTRSREWLSDETSNQVDSPLWHQQRIGRITASNMGPVVNHVDESGNITGATHSIVANVMSYYKSFTSHATKYGRTNETLAKKRYFSLMRKKHKHFNVAKTGLCISSSHPFIAASPDGCVTCKCCGAGLVEVKCPFRDNSLTVTEYASKGNTCLTVDDHSACLRKTHNYFIQVQCQLLCTNRKYCDFALITAAKVDNILVERIHRNEEVINEIKQKASSFWLKAILPELETRIVEKKVAYKYIKDMLIDSILKRYSSKEP